ncbi:signal recognition particle protein [candidate division WOR-3 bacterium]|nr:signal recognition particle protein [candidate division WOR-3 bacterium]
MFEGLIDRFSIIRRKVLGYGRITRSELDSILKDIRITLLEADVNYKVVKEFIEVLNDHCLKLELSRSLQPGDLIIKTVYEQLIVLLGQTPRLLIFKPNAITVISLLGLQGVGKTTTAAKIAVKYKGRKPLLVPADVKRPAAYEQLQSLGKRAGVAVFPLEGENARDVAKQAMKRAHADGHGLVIVDSAGRLHIDEMLVQELVGIHKVIDPDYRLLVADGMSGQDAVNQAISFKEKVGLEGAILTKMDGDARGGAALSISRAAGVPLFFVGTGEELPGIEEFHPDRMAQRILGMGDMASLVEKVRGLEIRVDEKKMRAKIEKGDLNFVDFLEQMKAVRKLGPLAKIAAMIPGVKETDVDEGELKKVEAMINSMTQQERLHPEIIDGSRKRRIAAGSGTSMQDINRLLKQFKMARNMLKQMGRKGKGKLPFPLQ